jgi:putative Mg2+ transporter-C (MgtC) family protein
MTLKVPSVSSTTASPPAAARPGYNLAMEILSIDLSKLVSHGARMLAAILLVLPVAWERERSTRSLGLRTFPLVSLASCGYVLLASSVIGAGEDAQARIIQGLMTGIGFIGGGAILKQDEKVSGTATAASIWATGGIGAAAGYGRYEIAILLSLLSLVMLLLLTPLSGRLGTSEKKK